MIEKLKEQQWLTKEKEEMKRAVIKEQKKFIKQQKEQEVIRCDCVNAANYYNKLVN